MRITVPGNLLLLGEYAVLEPGGLGVALALERRIEIRIEAAAELEVCGSWGRQVVCWSDHRPESSTLFSEVIGSCRRRLETIRRSGGGQLPEQPPKETAGRIRIDSSAFFVTPERKSGFGSSAAVAVGLSWAVLLLGGLEAGTVRRIAPGLALEAHRAASGGGSGYDVLTSAHGGIGLFTGGAQPRWQPRPIAWLPPLYLLRGPESVSSPRAVERYREWKGRHPGEARRFLERSNAVVDDFLAAGSWLEAEGAFRRSGELGLWLGERIGVPAGLWPCAGPPAGGRKAPCKAVGAGNELGVLVVPEALAGAGISTGLELLEPLVPAQEGVLWER